MKQVVGPCVLHGVFSNHMKDEFFFNVVNFVACFIHEYCAVGLFVHIFTS
jgi:hypothetical protein